VKCNNLINTGGTILLLLSAVAFASAAFANPRVAVDSFDNKVKGVFGSWNLGEGLAEMLVTELHKSGKYTVLERQALDAIVSEQGLAQSGLVREGSGPQTGQMLGAQYLIKGAVTEFADKASGYGGGVQWKGLNAGGQASKAIVGIDLRVIDTSTSQVIAAHSVKRRAKSSGGQINYANSNVQIGGGAFNKTPLGKAARKAIRAAVKFVAKSIPAAGGSTSAGGGASLQVVKVSGDRVYINGGRNKGLQLNETLQVYSAGEELIDPVSGLNLGSEEQRSGAIRIERIEDKFSVGVIIDGGGFQRGDSLRSR